MLLYFFFCYWWYNFCYCCCLLLFFDLLFRFFCENYFLFLLLLLFLFWFETKRNGIWFRFDLFFFFCSHSTHIKRINRNKINKNKLYSLWLHLNFTICTLVFSLCCCVDTTSFQESARNYGACKYLKKKAYMFFFVCY